MPRFARQNLWARMQGLLLALVRLGEGLFLSTTFELNP